MSHEEYMPFSSSAGEHAVESFGIVAPGVLSHTPAPPPARPAADSVAPAEWNDTATAYPSDSCVHKLFEERAALTPHATAVADEGGQLTYAELNRRADRLASYLRERGVGPDVLVGVSVGRSVELIVGLLGILKAGGAYVPLDANYPEERLSLMLQDTQVEVLLTQERLAGRMPMAREKVVCLDSDWEEIERREARAFESGASADSLAYVIYTSGSTGRPKGVMVTHRNIIRLVRNTGYADMGADQTFLQLAPVSFDASTFEIWGALLNGARLLVFPPRNPTLRELAESLERQRVTTLWLTAGLFHQMAEHHPEALAGVRQLLAGGDVLSAPRVRELLPRMNGHALINGYGPTESTTFACTFTMTGRSEFGASVPIGRPISNTRVYVLDRRMRPAGVGEPGELYIGGDGLARGYLNRPGLTAERFVPDPFGGEGGRLYRTGDLVKYLPDGNIEFIGRIDQQLKVRGYRIEAGEIEVVLKQHAGVSDAAVAARDNGAGDKQLVAYVVACGHDAPPADALRQYLLKRLPEYMVPTAFVTLDEFPLTPNGKIDRAALPSPQARGRFEDAYAAPRTQTEIALCDIWAEVLRVGRVGTRDNFFELGGHSLMATQVSTRVLKNFNVELPLRAIMESPTVEALARVAEDLLKQGPCAESSPITSDPSRRHTQLSSGQKRLWFLDRLSPGTPLYNVPALWRLRGQLDAAALSRSLSALAARHGALRTCYPERGGSPAQLVLEATPLALPVVDLASLPGAERVERARRLLRRDARRPFDLSSGPLVRARLVRLSAAEHLLQLTAHHIATDGWSVGVIEQELRALYAAEVSGEPAGLAPLSISYADYAAWQGGRAESAEDSRQLDYWKERLAGAPPPPEWPSSAQGVGETKARKPWAGGEVRFVLGARTSEGVRELALRCGATPFMVLLSALKVVLWRQTGQADVVVGTAVANRRRAELEGLVGFFVNTLALRTDLSGAPSFEAVVGRVKETCLGAYANQDVAFERIVEAVRAERGAGGGNPLFSVMAVLQNGPGGAGQVVGRPADGGPADGSGISWAREWASAGAAKFDLTLSVEEGADGHYACELTYARTAFSRDASRRIARQFARVVRGGVREPKEAAGRLRLLGASERREAVEAWGGGITPPCDWRGGVVAAFERVACGEARERAAVWGAAGEAVSYGELNARANRLARHLALSGVGPESCVGVLLERGARWVEAVLGILKAGAAYVPLDPDYPAERLKYMIEDARVSTVLTEEKYEQLLSAQGVARVCIDADRERIARQCGANLETLPEADNLAYVMYTSGSTGNPKGVCVTHAAINRLVLNTNYVSLRPHDRVAQASNASFDAATFEVWGALLSGATLCVMEKDVLLSVQSLGRYLSEHRINVMFMTTALFHEVVRQAPSTFSGLRDLLVGGEAMEAKVPAEVLKHGAPERLLNVYGPTETTTFATWRPITAEIARSGMIPIGRPITSTRVYVLDECMEPAPVGVVGEVYVGGEGLARGYMNRPAQTAERFVPDPVSGEPGARLYRTGDLGRWREGGDVEFVGRADNQVKVRGHRIEPGEVEEALALHKAVERAFVIVREDAPGDRRLVAYVACGRGLQTSAVELRAHLKKRLPAYMTPSAFVLMDTLPLTPNGKVDRRALPAPEPERGEACAELVGPRTHVEELLCGIWADALGLAEIGVHDNFFRLGGHSLLATRVVSRMGETFSFEVPLRAMFQAGTVAEMAAYLEGLGAEAGVDVAGIAAVVVELNSMSDEEVRAMLEERGERSPEVS